jgi:hypothetical protein
MHYTQNTGTTTGMNSKTSNSLWVCI